VDQQFGTNSLAKGAPSSGGAREKERASKGFESSIRNRGETWSKAMRRPKEKEERGRLRIGIEYKTWSEQ